MSTKDLEKIKEVIKDFFSMIEENISISQLKLQDDILFLDIESQDPHILIGEKGQTLFLLQHLLKKIIIKKFGARQHFYLDLDINSYKEKKRRYLQELAQEIADEVSLTKEEKELIPMSPYERRIIHLEISKRNDVISYSIGKGQERRVVVKPVV